MYNWTQAAMVPDILVFRVQWKRRTLSRKFQPMEVHRKLWAPLTLSGSITMTATNGWRFFKGVRNDLGSQSWEAFEGCWEGKSQGWERLTQGRETERRHIRRALYRSEHGTGHGVRDSKGRERGMWKRPAYRSDFPTEHYETMENTMHPPQTSPSLPIVALPSPSEEAPATTNTQQCTAQPHLCTTAEEYAFLLNGFPFFLGN